MADYEILIKLLGKEEMSGAFERGSNAVEELESSAKSASEATRDLAEQSGRAGNAVSDLEGKSSGAANAAEDLSKQNEDAANALNDVAGRSRAAASGVADLEGTAAGAADAVSDLEGNAAAAAESAGDLGTESGNAANAVEDLGTAADSGAGGVESLGNESQDAANAVDDLGSSANKAGKDLADMEQRGVPSLRNISRAAAGIGALILGGIGALTAGAMDTEAGKEYLKTLTELKDSVGELVDQLGGQLIPRLNELTPAITGVVNGITEWSKEHPTLSAGILILIAVIGALLLGLGTVGLVITKMITLIKGAVGLAAAIDGLIVVIGIPLAAAIGLAVAALILIIARWDEIKQGVKELGRMFKEFIDDPLEYFKANWDLGIRFVLAILDDLLGFFAGMFEAFGIDVRGFLETWDSMSASLRSVWQSFCDWLKGIWDSTVGWMIEKAKELYDWLNPWATHSPSMADNWASGMAAMRSEYAGLAAFVAGNPIRVASPAMAAPGLGGYQPQAAGNGGGGLSTTFSQSNYFSLPARGGGYQSADDARLARDIAYEVRRAARSGLQ